MIKFLIKEFHFSFAEIADLTDYQIRFLCRDDEKEEESNSATPQQVFESVWASRGMSKEDIIKRWNTNNPDEPWEE